MVVKKTQKADSGRQRTGKIQSSEIQTGQSDKECKRARTQG